MEVKVISWSEAAPRLQELTDGEAATFQAKVRQRRAVCKHAKGECVDMVWLEWIDGRELVIAMMQGEGAAEVVNHLHAQAWRGRLTRVRFHTKRPGLSRLIRKTGFKAELQEYVYSVKV